MITKPDKATIEIPFSACRITAMKNAIRKLAFVISLGFSATFCFAYYALHFKWRTCYNELGRCFDSDTGAVYLEQSGIAWLFLAAVASSIAAYQLWRLTR